MSTALRVGLLGCGNVGGALVRLMVDDADRIAARTGLNLELAAVAVRSQSREREVPLPAGRSGRMSTPPARLMSSSAERLMPVLCVEAEVPRREQQHPLGVEAADVGAPGPVPGPGVRVRRAEAVGAGPP